MRHIAVDLLIDKRPELGEGPIWDDRVQRLVWIDVPAGAVHTTDISTSETTTVEVGRPIGAIAPRQKGGYVVAVREGFGFLDNDLEIGPTPLADSPELRMNDGACDPAGRYLAGSMAFDLTRDAGALYQLGVDHSHRVLVEPVSISNGLGWSPDGSTMYYSDSLAGGIDTFDYDLATGDVSNRARFAEIGPDLGFPDGLTVDREGGIWVAVWGAGRVCHFTSDGTLEAIVDVPTDHVTSCAFGREDLGTLFITTAREGLTETQLSDQPHAGGVFAADVGTTGLPTVPYRG